MIKTNLSSISALTFSLFILVLVAFDVQNAHAQSGVVNTLPDLIVLEGKKHTIPAQRWEFSRVEVQKGATLIVTPGSNDVLHLVVRGSFILNGTILAEGFSSEERQITLNVPGRPPVSLSYTNTNKGGRGGNGGQGGGNIGGVGATGGVDFGGGGGGGGGRFADATGVRNFTGTAGQDDRGGPAGRCGRVGGDGALRSNLGNGGAIYLEIYGDFDGREGLIKVTGSPGNKGADGGRGVGAGSPYGCQHGAGGGGGGAPGGQGGFVVVYFTGRVLTDYPQVLTSGGTGGAGGLSPADGPVRAGTPGTAGQRGKSGQVFWFPATVAP